MEKLEGQRWYDKSKYESIRKILSDNSSPAISLSIDMIKNANAIQPGCDNKKLEDHLPDLQAALSLMKRIEKLFPDLIIPASQNIKNLKQDISFTADVRRSNNQEEFIALLEKYLSEN